MTWTKWWVRSSSILAAWPSWFAIPVRVSTGCAWTPSPFHNIDYGCGMLPAYMLVHTCTHRCTCTYFSVSCIVLRVQSNRWWLANQYTWASMYWMHFLDRFSSSTVPISSTSFLPKWPSEQQQSCLSSLSPCLSLGQINNITHTKQTANTVFDQWSSFAALLKRKRKKPSDFIFVLPGFTKVPPEKPPKVL